MLEHDYTTLFRLEHMLKDVAICLDESEAAGVPFPAAALARELYAAAMGRGLADAGLRGGARGGRGTRRHQALTQRQQPRLYGSMSYVFAGTLWDRGEFVHSM